MWSMTPTKIWIDSLHWLYLLSSLVPKSPDIWVFGAWFGQQFSDNPRQLFLYARAQGEKKCVWITRSRRLEKSLREQGYCAHYYTSLPGIFFQLRAGVVFFTHDTSIDMLGPAISSRTRRFQLWHGTPLKAIRYGNLDGHRGAGRSCRRHLIHGLFPWKLDVAYDFVPAASPVSVSHLQQAFGTNNVWVTGYPRNDVLLPGSIMDSRPLIRRCIYMPTFRGQFRTADSSQQTTDFLESTGFDVDHLDALFFAVGMTLTLRLHPTNMPERELIEKINSSRAIRLDNEEEIYEALNKYDLLIVDYSSIFFDFLITGKPIIHAPFDLDNYQKNSRQLYFDYDDICLTPGMSSWDRVFDLICQLRDQDIPADYALRYEALAGRFNQYRDSESSRRVYEWAKSHVR